MTDPMETSRLILRPFTVDDVEPAHGWFSDPAVMRYTLLGPDKVRADTAARIAFYERHQADHGYSKWIIIDRASGRPAGDAGLIFLPEHQWIDFGYRLAQPFWGRGLATEAASAWVQAAFGPLRLECLTAIVHPEHTPSIRVLQKLGFVQDRREVIRAIEWIVCRLFASRNDPPGNA